ncbi:hypothetical protein EVAR_83553_1 [Eumeta japonica]|uniref:Uncharacterized protein n=1 Tax=Eumeta variegata TaxID=151549 RepID=A0A4C2A989_EUMVA|nr:hypothetical protein EVAR_83553_1 [Eumeta japonica]
MYATHVQRMPPPITVGVVASDSANQPSSVTRLVKSERKRCPLLTTPPHCRNPPTERSVRRVKRGNRETNCPTEKISSLKKELKLFKWQFRQNGRRHRTKKKDSSRTMLSGLQRARRRPRGPYLQPPPTADPRVDDPRTDSLRRYLRPPSRAPRPARRRPTRCYLRTANPRVPFGPAYYLSSYLLPTRAPATGLQISDSDIEQRLKSIMTGAPPGPVGASGSKKLSFSEMKNMFFQFLAEQGYVIPEEAKQLLDDNSNSREPSPSPSVCSGKRSSSVMSSNESSEQSDVHSDDTIKGSDNESVNSFVVYNKKRRNPKRRAVRRHTEQTDNTSNTIPMETEQIAIASAIAKESSGSPINNSVASTSPKQVNNGASTNSTSPINNNIKTT